MQSISPAYFEDIRTILLNRIHHLTDDEIDVILDVFINTH